MDAAKTAAASGLTPPPSEPTAASVEAAPSPASKAQATDADLFDAKKYKAQMSYSQMWGTQFNTMEERCPEVHGADLWELFLEVWIKDQQSALRSDLY